MSRPKFEVGEVVLLRSESCPNLNCEAAVRARREGPAGTTFMEEDNKYNIITGGYVYFLDVDLPNPKTGAQLLWAESALRKKHQPGEMGFHDLMASLVAPKLLTHQPGGVVAAPPV